MAQQDHTTKPDTTGTQGSTQSNYGTSSSTTQSVKEQAKDVASTAQQSANEAAASVREGANQAVNEASKMASQLQGEAKKVASDVTDTARSKADEQKDRAASRLSGVASALRESSSNFRSQDEEAFAQYAESAAEQVDRFSGYLRDQNVGDLMRDVKQMARRQPEMFVAGALAAGFLLGRFLKSSESRQLPTSYQGGYPGGQGSGYAPSYGYGSQSYGGQHYGEQSYTGQSYGDQNYGGQNYGSQSYSGQTYNEQLYGRGYESTSQGSQYGREGTQYANPSVDTDAYRSTTGGTTSTTGQGLTGQQTAGQSKADQNRSAQNTGSSAHAYATASTVETKSSSEHSGSSSSDTDNKKSDDKNNDKNNDKSKGWEG